MNTTQEPSHIYRKWIDQFTIQELKKDVGKGDLTTSRLFKKPLTRDAYIIFKQPGICAGRAEIDYFLKRYFFNKFSLKWFKKDGDFIKENGKFCKIRADLRRILKVERVILNLMGRMSGVATATYKLVKKAKAVNPNILITPTRKTLWGLLDKRACVLGGGGTHRLSLDDAVLIKDNHLDALDRNIEKAINSFFPIKGNPKFIEIEVENADEAFKAAKTFQKIQKKSIIKIPCLIMLDNFSVKSVKKTLKLLQQKNLRRIAGIEVSGGINEKNIGQYVKTGVDIISVGRITHSAEMIDISLKIAY